jgi:hypothetical protein
MTIGRLSLNAFPGWDSLSRKQKEEAKLEDRIPKRN